MIFTDPRILERHMQLDDTIGVLDMEIKSLELAQLFSWIFFPIWIVLTLMQGFCFFMFNDKLHSLSKILDESDPNGFQSASEQ